MGSYKAPLRAPLRGPIIRGYKGYYLEVHG